MPIRVQLNRHEIYVETHRDAFKLVQTGGLEPRENKQSWISKAFGSFSASTITRAIIGN